MSTRAERGPSRDASRRHDARRVRVLITGGAGLVGSALASSAPREHHVDITVRPQVELTDRVAVAALMDRVGPDLVIHTAYSKGDHADTVESTRVVAEACAGRGAALIHFSTDALFDGEHAPYDESATPSPVHPYGVAKAQAEATVLDAVPAATIIRTSLVLRFDGTDGTSAWVIETLRSGGRVTLFHDEYRTPILVEDLAAQTWEIAGLAASARSGVWHLGGIDRLSRVDLGRLLCDRFGLDPSLIDVAASASTGAPRPRDVSLSCARARAQLSVVPQGLGSIA